MSKKAKKVAETILKLRRAHIDLVKKDNFFTSEIELHWAIQRSGASMPYQDCLEAMKKGGLITDYNLAKDTAKE